MAVMRELAMGLGAAARGVRSPSRSRVAREDQTQLAGLGELVGGEHHQRLVTRRLHLVAQGRLAGAVAGDGRVLAEGDDERGDPGAEPLPEIRGLGARLLDRVVEDPGREDEERQAA